MPSRAVAALLIALLVIVHAQLWLGRGSLPRVASLKQQLATQDVANRDAQLRNDQLVSEVNDLQEGLGMVEELARQELGMVKPNEIFVQIAKGKH